MGTGGHLMSDRVRSQQGGGMAESTGPPGGTASTSLCERQCPSEFVFLCERGVLVAVPGSCILTKTRPWRILVRPLMNSGVS